LVRGVFNKELFAYFLGCGVGFGGFFGGFLSEGWFGGFWAIFGGCVGGGGGGVIIRWSLVCGVIGALGVFWALGGGGDDLTLGRCPHKK